VISSGERNGLQRENSKPEAVNDKLSSENASSKTQHAAEIIQREEMLDSTKTQHATELQALAEQLDSTKKLLAMIKTEVDAKCKDLVCHAEKDYLRQEAKEFQRMLVDQHKSLNARLKKQRQRSHTQRQSIKDEFEGLRKHFSNLETRVEDTTMLKISLCT